MTDNHKPHPVSEASLRIFVALADRDGGMRCAYCLRELPPERLSRDHIVPASRGGHRQMTNLVLACGPCNNAKGDRTPDEWKPASEWVVPILNRPVAARLAPARRNHKPSNSERVRGQLRRAANTGNYAAFVYIKFCATCQEPVDLRRRHPASHLLLDDASREPASLRKIAVA